MNKKLDLQKLLAPAALVILYAFFSIYGMVKGTNFFSQSTAVSIMDSTYFVGFLAFGITFIIITAGIDLSIGTNMMMSALIGCYIYTLGTTPGTPLKVYVYLCIAIGLLFAVLIGGCLYIAADMKPVRAVAIGAACGVLIALAIFLVVGINIWLCLIIVVVIATIVGAINGTLISRLKLPPFIATLGMMMMTQGLGSIVTKVTTQRFPSAGSIGSEYKSIFYKTASGFPSGIIYLGIFFLVALFLLNKTRFGRYTYAIGSNEESVRLSGVNVIKWKTLVYAVCGLFCGLSGIVYAATYTTIIPGTGNGLEMNAIAAVIIGGTSMSGGVGTMTGTLIGAFLMSVLKQGLMSMGLQGHFQTFFTGLVVILAVLLDIYRNKKATSIK